MPPHSNTSEAPPWTAGEAAAALAIGYIIGPALLETILRLVLADTLQTLPQGKMLLSMLLPLVCWGFLLWGFVRKYGRHNLLGGLGLLPTSPWMVYGVYIAAGVTSIYGLSTLMGIFIQVFDWHVQLPQTMFSKSQIPLITFFAVASAPFIEETAFRGFLQPALQQQLPAKLAIVLTALIFTMFHALYYGNPIALLYVALLGLILGTIRHASGSLIPGIAIHLINNAFAALLLKPTP